MDTEKLNSELSNYSFPSNEDIFSSPFEINDVEGIKILCVARQSENAKSVVIESFWPSALYNCLEDIFTDEVYENLCALSQPIKADNLNVLKKYSTALKGSYLELTEASELYQMFDTAEFKGYLGRDTVGLFGVVCVKSA